MVNNYTLDPMVIDAVTVGAVNSTTQYRIQSIEWVKPTATDHTATLLDALGNTIAEFKCVTANLNMIKYFNPPKPFTGLNVTALTSGKLLIARV